MVFSFDMDPLQTPLPSNFDICQNFFGFFFEGFPYTSMYVSYNNTGKEGTLENFDISYLSYVFRNNSGNAGHTGILFLLSWRRE